MLKRKVFFIVALVLVMMLAMTITAFATTYYCHLYPSSDGEHTAAVYTQYFRRDAVNWGNSDGDMILRLQTPGSDGYVKVPGYDYIITPGSLAFHEPQRNMGSENWLRTKIFPRNGLGGVEGTGDISDY